MKYSVKLFSDQVTNRSQGGALRCAANVCVDVCRKKTPDRNPQGLFPAPGCHGASPPGTGLFDPDLRACAMARSDSLRRGLHGMRSNQKGTSSDSEPSASGTRIQAYGAPTPSADRSDRREYHRRSLTRPIDSISSRCKLTGRAAAMPKPCSGLPSPLSPISLIAPLRPACPWTYATRPRTAARAAHLRCRSLPHRVRPADAAPGRSQP